MASCTKDSVKSAAMVAVKVTLILALLYFFICSLDLLSAAFRLLAGTVLGDMFSEDSFFTNPVAGLMLGVLGTVAVQSSSTFTSIIIAMVAAGIIPSVRLAVPVVMGSNIGTTVTNTIVSLTQIGNKEEFRRAFSAATVHDMFNWATVLVLLPLEVITHVLELLSDVLADSLLTSGGDHEVETLSVITDPFVDLIVQLNSTVLELWAQDECLNCTLLKKDCFVETNVSSLAFVPLLSGVAADSSTAPEGTEPCKFLFNLGFFYDWADWQVGLIVLAISLTMLCCALIFMVKLLNSLLKGAIAKVIKRVLNPNFKRPWANYAWGYVNLAVGAVMTFIVQSSSVFTSTLTPLVGIGLISVETVYPLFLGSNIGTTSTGLLAALANDASSLKPALQTAFVHLFFNITGILIFFPIPLLRIPIPLCKMLGKTTSEYRWFAIFYIILMFVALPLLIMVTSLNLIAFAVIWTPVGLLAIFVVVVNVMQRHAKSAAILPLKLRNWDFLPEPLHSLEPYDRILSRMQCCNRFRPTEDEAKEKDASEADSTSDVEHGGAVGVDETEMQKRPSKH